MNGQSKPFSLQDLEGRGRLQTQRKAITLMVTNGLTDILFSFKGANILCLHLSQQSSEGEIITYHADY